MSDIFLEKYSCSILCLCTWALWGLTLYLSFTWYVMHMTVNQFCFEKLIWPTVISENSHGFEYQTYSFAKENSTILWQSKPLVIAKHVAQKITTVIFMSMFLPASSHSEIVNSVSLCTAFIRFESEIQWKTMRQVHIFFRSCLRLIFGSLKQQAFFEEIFQRKILRHSGTQHVK